MWQLLKRCACTETCRHPFWYRFEHGGRSYRRSTRTANRQLANRIAERRHNAVLDGKDTEPTKPLLLSKHIADYLAHTKAHNRTAYKDKPTLDRFQKSIGDRALKDVSPFHVERWKQQRADAVSKSTVNREFNIVRGCFARAVEWGRINLSPCRTVKPYKVDDQRIRVLDDQELKALLACGDEGVVLVCRTTLECLPRLSEVLNIHRTNIGPTWIEFRRKGGKVSRAAVTTELRDLLVARCHAISGFAFGEGEKGIIPTQQTMTIRVIRALAAIGIQDASHHTMRHTGVTLMLEGGINPRVIQALAGWSSLRMLERYGHARDVEFRRAVEHNAARLQQAVTSAVTVESESA